MKKLCNILLLFLLPTLVFGQTLTTPTSQEVPVGVNGLGISGFSLDGYNSTTTYKVSLSITGNANTTFSVGTTTGLTRDYGYNSWSNISSVNFTGTPTNIQNALNSIKLNTTSTVDALINLSVVISTQLSNTYYNPTNGHMYKFVSGNVSYTSAKTSAANSTFQGESGYLVTITSADEQSFVQSKVYGNNIWIALSDEGREGVWKIDAGPENGTTVWTTNNLSLVATNRTSSYHYGGTTATGQYSKWSSGEPNNAYGSYGEDHAVMKWSGGTGWNDLYKSYPWGIGGYVIEYGDWTDPTQSTFNSTQQTQITFTQKDIPYVDINLNLNSNITPENLGYKVYYDATDEQNGGEWYNTSTTNATRYVGEDGKANVTEYLNEVMLESSTEKKATTTGGSVEWCVIYDYDNTNKRYRILIDKREFPSGVSASDVKKLQLFDLWDGDVTYHTDDAYWAQYYIYTDTQFNFSNSSYSSYIRDANGYYGTKAEFSFEAVSQYKQHKLVFSNYGTILEFIDDYVTVADVVSAFSELSGGGINGGFKGDLNGIQLQNADINLDGKFDFQDTFKLLKFLQGDETLTTYNRLFDIIRLKKKSDYDGTTTSNWDSDINEILPNPNLFIDLNEQKVQISDYKVAFLGDVNLSHSSQMDINTTSKVNSSPRLMSSKNETNLLQLNFDVDRVDDDVIITLTIPQNIKNITGAEFRVGFDNTRLMYDKMETTSTLSNFDVQRTEYIKVGSISSDGSKNLNGGVEYKLHFNLVQSIDSILGLITIIKSELVLPDGTQIGSIIK